MARFAAVVPRGEGCFYMLYLEQHDHDGVCVMSLRGEAGVAEAQVLTDGIIALAAARPQRLVFDLSALTFISSLAMGDLASLAAALRRYGCRLAIAGATPLMRGALHRVRLDRAYEMFEALEPALREFGSAGADLQLAASRPDHPRIRSRSAH